MENVARVERKFEFEQIQPNSSQLKPSELPNDAQLHWSCELGSSWIELGGPFGQGFSLGSIDCIHPTCRFIFQEIVC